MIGIVVAMEKEAKNFIDKMINTRKCCEIGKDVYEGNFNNKKVVLIISGIGKVNSALSTQYLIDNYKPDYVLNFGTTGAIDKNMQVGDVYIVKQAMQYDFDLSEIDDCEVGYMQDYDTKFYTCNNKFLNEKNAIGVLATADRFSNNVKEIEFLIEQGCNLKDMEGGAIFQVCRANNVELLMIKSVSDVYGQGTMTEQYLKNVKIASQKLIEYLEKIV